MRTTTARESRSATTRETILTTAERLFAEHGVHGVSNRQISEQAGQGNNAAVGYHFGSKSDLIVAILRSHRDQVENRRQELSDACSGSTDIRDWLTCLVRPTTDHLATLGAPSWYAQFGAQVNADPSTRAIVYEEAFASPALTDVLSGLENSVSTLPERVRAARVGMARQLLIQYVAERELAMAVETPDPAASWYDCGTDLIDALVGLWEAPVTS